MLRVARTMRGLRTIRAERCKHEARFLGLTTAATCLTTILRSARTIALTQTLRQERWIDDVPLRGYPLAALRACNDAASRSHSLGTRTVLDGRATALPVGLR